MTYEIYRYIFIVGALLSGIMLALSVTLFFLLRIPAVVGDLTGRTARRAIEDIRSRNESTGEKAHLPSRVNRERGRITDRITNSGRIRQRPPMKPAGGETGRIITRQLEPLAEETTPLATGTTPLATGTVPLGTGMAASGANETVILGPAHPTGGETTVLERPSYSGAFTVEYEITFIHTDERIDAFTA